MADDSAQDTSTSNQPSSYNIQSSPPPDSPSADNISSAENPPSASDSSSADNHRPISSNLADETNLADTPSSSPSANITPPEEPSDKTTLDNQNTSGVALNEQSESNGTPPTVEGSVTPSPSPSVSFGDLINKPSPNLNNPSDLNNLGDLSVTSIHSEPQQTPQVQPEAPNTAFQVVAEPPPTSSAEIKPEPPEQPKVAPLADENNSNPSSPPPTSSNSPLDSSISQPNKESFSPPVSFGDLLNKSSSDLGSLSNISDLSVSTPPNPPPTTNNPPPIPPSPPSPQSPTPPQAIPPSPPPVITFGDLLREVRQKGQEVRRQKREARLNKIFSLFSTRPCIINRDVRDLLHVSQSTATAYLSQLIKMGKLVKEGKGKYLKYRLP